MMLMNLLRIEPHASLRVVFLCVLDCDERVSHYAELGPGLCL